MFAELLGRSCFSFLRGASHPEELVERAHQLGHAAFGLCDLDGLYGVVRGWTRARDLGLPFLVGAELTLGWTEEGAAPRAKPLGFGGSPDDAPLTLALLAQTSAGYQNQIGRASCRERVEIGVVAVASKQTRLGEPRVRGT